MNESTNNQVPKKSFWAKLFGGKDNTQTQSTAQPIPVPPTNQTVVQTSTDLPDTPPVSELPPSSDTVNTSETPNTSAPSQAFASNPVASPADQPESAVPSEFVAQPPSDPMVTPVSTPSRAEEYSPVPGAQPPTETQSDSLGGSEWNSPPAPVQDIAPVVAPITPDSPPDSLNQSGELPLPSPVAGDNQTPPNSPVV